MAGQTVVVGAGLAGLSAAIHLAAAGRDVVVVEAEAVPGGRCGTATVGGYRFDTGPSVLTMPEVVRATVGAAGEELEDWLELAPLDPTYRLTFHDGSRLDVLPGAERMAAEVERLAGPEGVTGVVLAGGERLAAGDVVVTADLPAAYEHLLPPAARDWRVQRRRLHFAPSCYLVHLGLPRRLEGQAHHTVHLGRDWKGGFEALTRHGRVQPDPSL
ncbi:MAG TPA: FAD-dependent oxidoreductase, partial [Actinomycetes bacterium]|nr:FAD-dependent oxidoreductase [Actinomycetes bacterium]